MWFRPPRDVTGLIDAVILAAGTLVIVAVLVIAALSALSAWR